MNTRELIRYAEENGYNSVKFNIEKDGKHIASGEFLDAYYEFIKIPILGEGFCRLSDLESQLGYDISFEVITNEVEYWSLVAVDFILRGKEIPKYIIDKQSNVIK